MFLSVDFLHVIIEHPSHTFAFWDANFARTVKNAKHKVMRNARTVNLNSQICTTVAFSIFEMAQSLRKISLRTLKRVRGARFELAKIRLPYIRAQDNILTKLHNDSASFLPVKLKNHVILTKNLNI